MDASEFREFIFGMLFLKRLSDEFDHKREQLRKKTFAHLNDQPDLVAELLEDKTSYGETLFVPVRARWHEPWKDDNGDLVPALKDLKPTTREAMPMLMHDPPHPGTFIRRQCLEPLGLTVTEAAKGLAVSRNTLSLLLNGRLGISPEMAIRLSEAFGGSPESWLTQQMQYDLWHAQHDREPVEVRRFATA